MSRNWTERRKNTRHFFAWQVSFSIECHWNSCSFVQLPSNIRLLSVYTLWKEKKMTLSKRKADSICEKFVKLTGSTQRRWASCFVEYGKNNIVSVVAWIPHNNWRPSIRDYCWFRWRERWIHQGALQTCFSVSSCANARLLQCFPSTYRNGNLYHSYRTARARSRHSEWLSASFAERRRWFPEANSKSQLDYWRGAQICRCKFNLPGLWNLIVQMLTEQLQSLDGANINSMMDSENSVNQLLSSLDAALGDVESVEKELDRCDDILAVRYKYDISKQTIVFSLWGTVLNWSKKKTVYRSWKEKTNID